MPFTVVIAPDSFKGTVTAAEAAESIAAGWRSVRPDDRVILSPQADGGEGTIAAIEAAVAGCVRHPVAGVTGPDGRPVPGEWLQLPDGTAVVELAQVSGLPLMAELDALGATTRGLGEVILATHRHPVPALIVALGGSATTDGGSGVLAALGLLLLDARGEPIADGGGALGELRAVDFAELTPPPPNGITLLTDVTAPLTGPLGAAAVFGPQKGATASEVAELDLGLANFARVLGGHPDAPGAGAAGGTAYGLATALGARIVAGSTYLAELSGVLDSLRHAQLLITGEGRFDAQSTSGKVVGELLNAASLAEVPSALIAGQVDADPGTWACSLSELAGSSGAAMAAPRDWLVAAGATAARALAR